jgi:hypothetical protein
MNCFVSGLRIYVISCEQVPPPPLPPRAIALSAYCFLYDSTFNVEFILFWSWYWPSLCFVNDLCGMNSERGWWKKGIQYKSILRLHLKNEHFFCVHVHPHKILIGVLLYWFCLQNRPLGLWEEGIRLMCDGVCE